jgi:hypothetical protein
MIAFLALHAGSCDHGEESFALDHIDTAHPNACYDTLPGSFKAPGHWRSRFLDRNAFFLREPHLQRRPTTLASQARIFIIRMIWMFQKRRLWTIPNQDETC